MEIALLPTQELLDELSKRFDDCIFYGHKQVNLNLKDKRDKYWWDFRGCKMINIGLCYDLIEIIKDEQKRTDEHLQKDDI